MISKVKEINDKFIEIEKDLELFNVTNKKGIIWWDIVRYRVYEEIYHEVMQSDKIEKSSLKENIYNLLIGSIKDLVYIFNNILKNKEYVCFISSREKANKQFQDKIMYDLYSKVIDKSFIIESFASPCIDDRNYIFYNIYIKIIKKIISKLNYFIGYYSFKEGVSIANKITDMFDIKDKNKIFNLIKDLILEWKIEECYYTFLFRIIKPKKVFVIQNGVQKSIFFAANKLGIPCYEFQHGQMNKYHMLYTYPENIKGLQTLPLGIITFGTYWGNNYPVKYKKIIGKKFLLNNLKNNGICIIFNSQNFNKILDFTIELYNKNKIDKSVYIKLHPIQKGKFEQVNKLVGDKFIVLPMQTKIEDIYPKVDSIVVTDSTCIYEAIYLNKVVYVLDTPESYINEECFDNINVHIIQNTNILDEKYVINTQRNMYYQEYNEKIIDEILL